MSAHVEPVTDAMRGESRPEVDRQLLDGPGQPGGAASAPVTGTGGPPPEVPWYDEGSGGGGDGGGRPHPTDVYRSLPTAARVAVWAVGLGVLWLVLGALLPSGMPLGVVLSGAIIGSATGLTAVGLILIWRANRVINFANGANCPPSRPVSAIVLHPIEFAYSIARSTFGEFPEPLIPITTSSGRAKFLSCSMKMTSYDTSFEYAVIVGNWSVNAMIRNRFARFQLAPLHHVTGKMRRRRRTPPIAENKNLTIVLARLLQYLNRLLHFVRINPSQRLRQIRLVLFRKCHTLSSFLASSSAPNNTESSPSAAAASPSLTSAQAGAAAAARPARARASSVAQRRRRGGKGMDGAKRGASSAQTV